MLNLIKLVGAFRRAFLFNFDSIADGFKNSEEEFIMKMIVKREWNVYATNIHKKRSRVSNGGQKTYDKPSKGWVGGGTEGGKEKCAFLLTKK